MKFDVGSLVVEKDSVRAHTSYNIQKVVAHLDGALLVEHYGFGFDGEIHAEDYRSEPGTRGWRENYRRFQDEDFFTLEETKAELVRLETAKAILESEFEAIQGQIQAKLEQAAKFANEAAELLVKHDKTFEDVLEESCPLYRAMQAGGWRHSTMVCKYGR